MKLLRRTTFLALAVVLIISEPSSASKFSRVRRNRRNKNGTESYKNDDPMAPFLVHLDESLKNVANQLKNLRMPIREAEKYDGRDLQTGNVTAGDLQIAYVGTTATRAWVSVPIPYTDAQSMPSIMSFHGFPAVRGQVVGVHTVFYDVLVDLPVGKYLVGDLETTSPSTPAPASFLLSPWISDDLNRLFPDYSIVSNGQELSCGESLLTRELDTAAHLSYKAVTRCGGLVTEFFAHLFNDQEVVEWELFTIFSDYTVPNMDIIIDSFTVTFGEFIVVDDHVSSGLSLKTGAYDITNDTHSITLFQNTEIGHGQAAPVFKGALLCIDNSQPFFQAIRDPNIISSPKWSYLLARLDGIILAGRTNWDNRWLAFQAAIPRLAQDDAELDYVFNEQWSMMESPQPLFAKRKLGLLKNAGSTGMQQDFGSQKGTQATHGDIRFAATWHYHLQESMRPIHYREQSGEKTTGALQSGWVTWSQITHYHPSVSPNQLGKPGWWPGGEFHGWSGKDDQHKSSNSLNAAIATQDWPAYRSILRDEINVALENVHFLPGQDPGAPRAIGRRLLADSNAFLLTGDENVWERLVMWHSSNAFSKSTLGPAPENMRVSDISHGDKPPFLCNQTTNCIQGQHAPLPKIIVWQHGLLMKGLVAAWNTHLYRQSLGRPTLPNISDLENFIIELATTFIRHFYVQVDGQWQTWNYIAWNNGQPVDPIILESSSETAGYTSSKVTVGDGWWPWNFCGYYYLARANHGLNLPADVVNRLQSMALETETVLFQNSDFERREWYPFTS